MTIKRILKRDTFGVVRLETHGSGLAVARDTGAAIWGAQWLAKKLARREAEALLRVGDQQGLPALISFDGKLLRRSYLPGLVMYEAKPKSSQYFADALKLLCRIHRRGVAHNDLAKEANWLCMPGGKPAIVDFQIAFVSRGRGRLFRLLAREDLRHLLKHKQHYLRGSLTTRQRALLANPSLPARIWRVAVKPPYWFVTRRILRWPERDGPQERGTRGERD